MEKAIKAVVVILPGPILAWAAEWVGIFHDTAIFRPNAPLWLPNTAIACASVLVVVFTAFYFDASRSILIKKAGWAVLSCIAMVGSIATLRVFLQWPLRSDQIQTLFLGYDAASFLFVILTLLAIAFATLSAANS